MTHGNIHNMVSAYHHVISQTQLHRKIKLESYEVNQPNNMLTQKLRTARRQRLTYPSTIDTQKRENFTQLASLSRIAKSTSITGPFS